MELTVTMPKRNRLINKLFNTIEADTDISKFNKDVLNQIIKKSFGKLEEYDLIIEKKINKNGKEGEQNGQYIIIENDLEKKYIFFSFEYPKDTRNGFIISKIAIAFRKWYFDTTSKDKKLEICLLDVDRKYHAQINEEMQYPEIDIDIINTKDTINNYNTFAYKLCKTFGFKILNEDKLPYKQYKNDKVKGKYVYRKNEILAKDGFKSITEIKSMRDLLNGRNIENKGSYILEFEDSIVIYGKTFGNNGFEMVLIACAIGQLAKQEDKKVYFYQVKDILGRDGTESRNAIPITKENIKIMEAFGIKVYDELQDYKANPDAKLDENKDSRNQLEFMKNLMNKFGNTDEKKCYLCDCTIQKLIIASHIQRVCDINKLPISFVEKRKKAVDADNGLWLCANHDKLFEYGLIYFEDNKLVISDKVNKEQKKFIEKMTYHVGENLQQLTTYDNKVYEQEEINSENNFYIQDKDYNENMHKYLDIHKKRVNEN